jgi:hypothetical protein
MKKLGAILCLLFFSACQSHESMQHSQRLNDLIYQKEKLIQVKNQLELIDTNASRSILNNANLKLLNLESVLPKAITEQTASFILQYKNSYLKINRSNEKRAVLLAQCEKAIQQVSKLIVDMQNELLTAETEIEMSHREIDVARTILLAQSDFKTNILFASSQLKQLDAPLDSTINFYRTKKVE